MKQGKEGKMLFFLAILRIFWPVRQCVRLYFVAGTSIPEQCCYSSASVFLASSHNLSACGREKIYSIKPWLTATTTTTKRKLGLARKSYI